MLMLEIISGGAPFADRDYDLHLALDICKGERPIIPEYTPEPYSALMKRCWDSIPTNRPTTFEFGYEIIQLDEKLEIEEEFSKEREDRWKHD
ncbi:unnamed protein product [Rhizophagus irregularis]|nr:unnamed protein product [Rhizophagus irregularis]